MLIIIELLGIFGILFVISFSINFRFGETATRYKFMSFGHSGVYRGIAALMIFCCHVANHYHVRWLTPLGGVGVAIFLISSGYGLSMSSLSKHEGAVRYWFPKLIRLIVPYFLLEISVFITALVKGQEFSLMVFWYINFALFWYLIYFLINKVKFLKRFQIPVLCFTGIAVLFLGNDVQSEQAFSFVLGVLIAHNTTWYQEIITKWRNQIGFGFLFIILLSLKQVSTIRNLSGSVSWTLLQVVMKMSLALLILGLSFEWQVLLNHYLLRFYGMVSFEFYITHLQLIQISGNGLIGILALLVVASIMSIVFYYIGNELSKSVKARFS